MNDDIVKKDKKFIYRGPKSFYFKRKRFKLLSLKQKLAAKKISKTGQAGFFETDGSGESWHKNSEKSKNGWFRKRFIKAGQWFGGWIRIKNSDTE